MQWALLGVFLAAMAALVLRLIGLSIHPRSPEGDTPRRGWTIAWVAWFVVVLGGFFAIEIPALRNDSGGDTLTEHVQYVAGLSPVWTVVIGAGLASFAIWFGPHLFGRDSRVWTYLKRGRE